MEDFFGGYNYVSEREAIKGPTQ